jgi:hypothetical protein
MRKLGRGCSIANHDSQGTEVLTELSALVALLDAQEARLKALEATVAPYFPHIPRALSLNFRGRVNQQS